MYDLQGMKTGKELIKIFMLNLLTSLLVRNPKSSTGEHEQRLYIAYFYVVLAHAQHRNTKIQRLRMRKTIVATG